MTSIVVLGEKNHGKSTLVGRLLYETNSLPKDRLREIKRAARSLGKKFEWAYFTDSFRYERLNEMTLDTTRATCKINSRLYEFIDVPGHQELIKNMVSGASQAEYGIVVVAINEGIKPQTMRHLEIAKFLGVRKLIALVNKCDSADYSKKKFERISNSVAIALKKLGFDKTVILPVAARRGVNLLKPSRRLKWFSGPTLATAISKYFRQHKNNSNDKNFYMVVQDMYPGAIIAGVIKQGAAKRGLRVYTSRTNIPHQIKKIISHGIILFPHPSALQRGDVLSTKNRIILKKSYRTTCVFFKKPTGKITIEADLQEAPVYKIETFGFVLAKPIKTNLKLGKKISIFNSFVLKQENNIIGAGRVLEDGSP